MVVKGSGLLTIISVVAVVVLALTHNPEAATAVGTIGGAVTALGGSWNLRARR
ncbi:hypothetical protein ACFVYT_29255 [Streptomyces sp. NPDC058290]|uniref:hypothetical protein n=1 Tax=Streptomyces sp. NPDC058290 TaxID=3346426 RepID=UPI0036E1AC3E